MASPTDDTLSFSSNDDEFTESSAAMSSINTPSSSSNDDELTESLVAMSLADTVSSSSNDDEPTESPPAMLPIPRCLRRPTTTEGRCAGVIIPRPTTLLPRSIPVSYAFLLFTTRMAMCERVEHRNLQISVRNMEFLFHSWSTNPVATYLMTNGPFPIDHIRAVYESFGRTLPPQLNNIPDSARSEDNIATIRDAMTYEAIRIAADVTAVLDALTYDIGLRFIAEAVRTLPPSNEIASYAEILAHFQDATQRQADSETSLRIENDFIRAYNRPVMISTTSADIVEQRTQSTTDQPATAQNSNTDDTTSTNDTPYNRGDVSRSGHLEGNV
ncbi:Maltose/galactoside acetyltransferase [Penicillium cf. griseofulvum]|uniref:Maltose/galactoside acetyltransferase n=1 Tax=Penicillium cf. griseofulvum TaxID=2972120 RepID=A0A9W9J853_9EURO|nr:Maltose/galactoside acetyltransferase [Penicillium cf. griseofulvum]KAJ5431668.1 Maltose/galactoside acetyltransferase [Penicillium cf. griseofulvum]